MIAFVASAKITTGTSSGSTTAAANTTGANLIVLAVQYQTNATITVSDSAGNTWTALSAYGNWAESGSQMYYCLNPVTSSAHTFTVSGSGSYSQISALAFSGAGAIDQQAGYATTTIGNTSVQPGSITPSYANELIVSSVNNNGLYSISINDSFTAYTYNQVNNVTFGGGIAYLIQTSAAAIDPTWSFTASSGQSVAAIASFRLGGFIAAISGSIRLPATAAAGTIGANKPTFWVNGSALSGKPYPAGTISATAPSFAAAGAIAAAKIAAAGTVGASKPAFAAVGTIALRRVAPSGTIGLAIPSAAASGAIPLRKPVLYGSIGDISTGFNATGLIRLRTVTPAGALTVTIPTRAAAGAIGLPRVRAAGSIVAANPKAAHGAIALPRVQLAAGTIGPNTGGASCAAVYQQMLAQ